MAIKTSPRDRDRRFVSLAGTHNLRAVEDWHTSGGRRLRSGILYRSSGLEELTQADAAMLAPFGIAKVVDLRSEHERVRLPSQWHGVPSPRTWSKAHCAAAADLAVLIQGPPLNLEELREALLGVYRSFPEDLGPALAEVFSTLLSDQGGVLVHCAAGKDRTGFVIAMTLRALGICEEDVLADYFLTNQVFEEARSRYQERAHIAALESHTPGATRMMLEARGEYLAAADAVVAARWGSFEDYLEAVAGLDGTQRETLRTLLLEDK